MKIEAKTTIISFCIFAMCVWFVFILYVSPVMHSYSPWLTFLYLVLFCAPYLAVAALTVLDKGLNVRLGLIWGTGLVVFILTWYGLLALLFAVPLIAPVLPILVLQTVLVISSFRWLKAGTFRKGRALISFLLCFVGFGIVTEFYVLDTNHLLKRPHVRAGDEESLFTLAACAYRMRASSPTHEFPDSLNAIERGPASCQSAVRSYKDAEPDTKLKYRRTPTGFEFEADALNNGSGLIEEDGSLYDTKGLALDKTLVREAIFVWPFYRGLECLSKRGKEEAGKYFLNASTLVRSCNEVRLRSGEDIQSPNGNLKYGTYILQYSPHCDKGGLCLGFELQWRPVHYGRGGIRSYYADEHMVIHVTPEDRAANPSDPDAPKCEFIPTTPCTLEHWKVE